VIRIHRRSGRYLHAFGRLVLTNKIKSEKKTSNQMDPLQDTSFTIAEPPLPSPPSISSEPDSSPPTTDFIASTSDCDNDESFDHTFTSLKPPALVTSPTMLSPNPIPNASISPNGTPCCSPDLLHGDITIPESQKLNDYIAYTITVNSTLVKRRYSEFEGLRQLLTRLYPNSLVPPIPGKQGVTGRRDDAGVINMRKRMLTVFIFFILII
jgi:hypothetical protein